MNDTTDAGTGATGQDEPPRGAPAATTETATPVESAAPADTATTTRAATGSWWRGRGELSIGLLALVGATLLTIGTVTMHVRGDQQPGPQFFPVIVILLLAGTGGWITVVNLLPRRDEPEVWHRPDVSEDLLADVSGTNTEVIALEARHRPRGRRGVRGARGTTANADPNSFDWRTFGLVLAAVVAFAVLLDPVGWVLSAALLFWVISYALGSTRPVFDIGVALLMSSLVQLAFSAGLGLTLPAGFIGRIF